MQSLKFHFIFSQTRCHLKGSLVSRGLAVWGRESRGSRGWGGSRRCRMQRLQEQQRCCCCSGKPWLLASLLCALKNSKANNLNYSPASLGAAADAFVCLSPNVKAKIVFCLQGHRDTGEINSPCQGKKGQRITGWVGLGRIFKNHLAPTPLTWARTTSTRRVGSKCHPTYH